MVMKLPAKIWTWLPEQPRNPNDYSPPRTREPLPLHVAMTPAEIRAHWEAHAPQARKR